MTFTRSLRPQPCHYLLTESLNELEDHDLDALVADLGSESIKKPGSGTDKQIATSAMTQECEAAAALPPPSNTAEKVLRMVIWHLSHIIKMLKYVMKK